MTSALAYKEFRETIGIAALALAVLLAAAAANMGWQMLPVLEGRGQIPFVNDFFSFQFAVVAGILALALGFRQSVGDFFGDAYLFLLHRPVSRRQLFGAKLLVGLATYAICAALPLLLYAWWASLPGTHASPFEWSMTADIWLAWLAIGGIYLGAFLSGIRPGKWLGTRLMPVVATFALAMLVSGLLSWGVAVCVLLVAEALLIALILFVSETRDFA